MELVEDRPNVELRRGPDGRPIVVLSFPYDPHIVAVVRGIPQPPLRLGHARVVGAGRRLGRRPRRRRARPLPRADDERARSTPGCAPSSAAGSAASRRRATTAAAGGSCARAPGRGAGGAARGRGRARGRHAARRRSTAAGAEALAELSGAARLDAAAERCVAVGSSSATTRRPRASASATTSTASACASRCCGTRRSAPPSTPLPGAERPRARVPIDPWVVEPLDAFLGCTTSRLDGAAKAALAELRAEDAEAPRRSARSRATTASRSPRSPSVLGGDAGAVPVGGRPLRAATRGAPSSPTSRGSARRSRRSRRWRPTTPSRRSSSAPRR